MEAGGELLVPDEVAALGQGVGSRKPTANARAVARSRSSPTSPEGYGHVAANSIRMSRLASMNRLGHGLLRRHKRLIISGLYFARFRPDRALRNLLSKRAAEKLPRGARFAIEFGAKSPLQLRAHTHDIDIFEQIFVLGDCYVPTKLSPQLIIDGGAHIGCSAITFAQAFPAARIIAVELDRANYELLKVNVAPYDRITCIHGAIWSHQGPLNIHNPLDDPWAFRVGEPHKLGGSVVEGITIDQLLKQAGNDRIGLLKLDIEAAEKEVFSSNYQSWLPKTDAIMIELHDRIQDGCSKAFYSAIGPFGFRLWRRSVHNVTVVRST